MPCTQTSIYCTPRPNPIIPCSHPIYIQNAKNVRVTYILKHGSHCALARQEHGFISGAAILPVAWTFTYLTYLHIKMYIDRVV